MSRPICLLLIHGFGGTTQEIAPLARQLEQRGLTVAMARLAGHGEPGSPIDNLSCGQWVASVRNQVQRLSRDYRVIPVGFSMGGLIAVTLYSEQPFDGMVFVNTPIYFWNLPQLVKNLLCDFSGACRYYAGSAGRVTPYTMVQFLRLLLQAQGLFPQVDCPGLVVQSQDDESVWPASADFISKRLGQPPERYRAAGGHQVLKNPYQCQAIADRIAALCSLLE